MQDLKPTFEHYYPQGSGGGQCAAFAEKLVKFGPVGDLLAQKLAYVKKFGSTNIWDIQVGDVVLTNDSKLNGHMFVVNCDKVQFWQVTESNFDGKEHVSHTRLVSKFSPKMLGHIRSTLLVKIINQMTTTKVNLYKSNVVHPEIVSAGIDFLNQKIAALTPDFNLVTNVFVTDRQFTAIDAGPNKIQVDPNEILLLPAGALVTCLVHNVPTVTNPFHSAQVKDGATPIQLPENWFGTYPNVFAEFYMHELMHAYYYIADNLPYDQQIAKVHNPPPNWGGYNVPVDYYLSLLMELKPFWPKLAEGGKIPMNTYKFSDNATEFILTDNGTLIPVSAAGLAKTLAGRPERLVVLAPSERSKYTIVTSSVV